VFFAQAALGTPAREWCTPGSLSDKQLFPCKQIRVFDNDHLTGNSWYAFGAMGEDAVFEVDKDAITDGSSSTSALASGALSWTSTR
jgi:transitional endoplasmic reticulum ATPase